jgi:hypothetical protein
MGSVHRLLSERGKQGALEIGVVDRRELDAAAAFLADEDTTAAFLYSGWCQAALPHKRLGDTQGWQITSEQVSLLVEPGMRIGKAGPEPVGVPYGSRAKLILIFLQTEAVRTQSREVELGGSLRWWLARLGIAPGGPNIAAVRDQAERISRCHLTFQVTRGRTTGLLHQNIMETSLFIDNTEEGQGSLFLETATLSDGFFKQLQKHPVPLAEAAIRQLSNNSMGLDTYAWLAYRLHSLTVPTPIHWRGLMNQFGGGFQALKHFKPRFIANLRLALAVYPDAKVEIDDERGLVLHPSRPPILHRRVIG